MDFTNPKRKTFLQLTYPPPNPDVLKKVETRDWRELDIPKDTIAFIFFDILVLTMEYEGEMVEFESNSFNESPIHYINAELLSLNEFADAYPENYEKFSLYIESFEERTGLVAENIIITNEGIVFVYKEGDIIIDLEKDA